MSDIELRVLEAWKNYTDNHPSKPDCIRLTSKDHYALSKSLNSDELITDWNGIEVVVTLQEDKKILFLSR